MRHEDIERVLEEISRHNRSSNLATRDSDNHDMDNSDTDDEFGYEILIFVLVFCVLIAFVIAKSLISVRSKPSPVVRTGLIK